MENSRKNPDSLFYFYQKLIALRRKNDTLVYGDFRLIEEENPDIFAYERNLEREKADCALQFPGYSGRDESPI